MRLLVARCEVLYTGRLTARLPEAIRLLMFKADGSFLSCTTTPAVTGL
jgi:RecB family endonuclease NucS